MWLISGGAYQGKLEYALSVTGIHKKEVVDGRDCSMEQLLTAPLVNHFHLWIDRMLRENQELLTLVEEVLAGNPGIVIIQDELGCGVVPMEPYDRRYRELTGRIGCRLAGEAKEVHRVMCGIGTVIKHA